MTKMIATVLAATLISAGAAFAAPAPAKAPAKAPAAHSQPAKAAAAGTKKAATVKKVSGKVKSVYVGPLKKLPRHRPAKPGQKPAPKLGQKPATHK